MSDPRVTAIQEHFADERQAGRMIFTVDDAWIAKILEVADRAGQPVPIFRRIDEKLDAILRGQHAGWDRALSDLREEVRVKAKRCAVCGITFRAAPIGYVCSITGCPGRPV